MSEPWRSIATRKQEDRDARIPNAWRLRSLPTAATIDLDADNVLDVPRRCGLLTHDELLVTEKYEATDLVAEIAKGKLKSEGVVLAFCKRAAIAHQLSNCLTEIFFDDALARARDLDAYLARTGKCVGPLHGLPISLKDSFKIKGYDSSLGVANLCYKPATANSALVDQLLSLGAVLYCKTNVPQTLIALDSHNNIFGRTLNPAHRALTAGGSSGGEGALIALRGSILGVGTDVGGSIRIPAACNDIYSIKPSHGRVPYAGQAGGVKPGSSKVSVEPVAGPLATSLQDCEMFLRVIGNSHPDHFDPDTLSQTWEQQHVQHTWGRTLRIGIVRSDGHVKPLPAIERVFDEVVQTLLKSNPYFSTSPKIELVELDLTALLSRFVKPFNGIMSIDGANAWFDHLEATSEPLSPWLQNRLRRRAPKTLDDVVSLQAQKLALQSEFLSVWHAHGGFWLSPQQPTPHSSATPTTLPLDALICPIAPHPIPPIDTWNTVNYTSAWNFLDLPAGTLPIRPLTKQDLAPDLPPDGPQPLNGWDKTNRGLWTAVDRSVYLGSPFAIQVITPRLMERKLLQVMTVLEKALRPLRATASSPQNTPARSHL